MNILLSFVGKQDPISEKTNKEGAVLTLCKHLQPDLVYLFPTAEGPGVRDATESNAYATKELLPEVSPRSTCYVRSLYLKDPTDFSELMPSVKEEVRKILAGLEEEKKNGQDVQIHLNCSSGTPQMQTCWYVLANSGYIPGVRLWQVKNPDLSSPEERIREIQLNFLEEENSLSRIRRCLPEFLFGVMVNECRRLQEISMFSSRRLAAELVADIFEAYRKWDLLKYREAYEKLASIERRWRATRDAGTIAESLRKQVDYLKRLEPEKDKETPHNLVDIYFNAQRCFARRAYADVLARFWRIFEGVVYYRLREKWGIEPRNLSESSSAQNREAVATLNKTLNKSRDMLDRATGIKALKEVLKDKEFIQILELEVNAQRSNSVQKMKLAKLLDELTEKRHASVVAHGMKPVSEEDAVNGLAAAKTLLSNLLPDGDALLASYPLQRAQIEQLIDYLAKS